LNSILWDNTAKYGPQIALANGTHLYAAYNCIEGGSDAMYREIGTTLSWADTNIARNPRFNMAFPSDTYQLSETSLCIDGGSNQAVDDATDLLGQPRIYNQAVVDIGATEYQGLRVLPSVTAITLTELTVKAGTQSGVGSAVVTGPISVDRQAVQDAQFIYVAVGPFSLEFDVNPKLAKFKGNTFSYAHTPVKGSKVTLTIDFAKQTFKLDLKNVNLAGIACPVAVEIGIGETNSLRGTATQALLDETGNTLPMSLLSGYADALRVDNVKLNGSEKPDKDSLTLSGAIALLVPETNLAQYDVAITFGNGGSGDLQLTLPVGSMHRVGSGNIFVYKKPNGFTGPAVTAKFDFDNGVFKITVKNTDINTFAGATNFRLRFADFDQTAACP
jgi:hypothetical protein